MSREKQTFEAKRWLQTAREDLAAADTLFQNDLFSHSCFLAQQAAEKAIKALWHNSGEEPWGHSIQRLLTVLPDLSIRKELESLLPDAVLLDRYYIPTRYPNGLPDLTPGQVYFMQDAEAALRAAVRLVSKVSELMAEEEEG